MTDIHSRQLATAIHIPKAERDAAIRVIDTQPDADTIKQMLRLG